jgi:hypothetical protein
VASIEGLKRLQHLRKAERLDEVATTLEQAARCYEERGELDCAELLRLVAAIDRKDAEELRCPRKRRI